MKTITFRDTATASFRRMPSALRTRLIAKLERYATTGAGDVKRMTGAGTTRLRVGDYRIVFVESANAIDVVGAGKRGEIIVEERAR